MFLSKGLNIFCFILIFSFVLEKFFLRVQGSSSELDILETGQLSCLEIQEIISVHNELRESIANGSIKNQPSASNMREMYWDEELAVGAQNWANKCRFEHNSQEERDIERFHVGQNLGQTISNVDAEQMKEFKLIINKWFEEHFNYDFGPISNSDPVHVTGHYTQVVWANTYAVGCGYSKFKTEDGLFHKLYVCSYGPTGNIIDETPYKTGSQKCPSYLKPSKTYPSLCSPEKSPPNACKEPPKSRNFFFSSDELKESEEKEFLASFEEPENSTEPKINLMVLVKISRKLI